ncbi:MAG: hypothetical protein KKA99_06030 [Gammaproteobacteria bacterium]|nr:hypothetical protein [Gammaproteobacteria bacterium]MBU2546262.1 hypothetical protein [Gammaproteobacteria bacterium]
MPKPSMTPPVNNHEFHIPVMGTGFTIDTPLKVAKYGISSVISLVDDVLIEQMRKFYCKLFGRPYTPITNTDEDPRAHRITAYLNLIADLVTEQVKKLQASGFEKGSDITRYFELLPPESMIKKQYFDMLRTEDPKKKFEQQEQLRFLAAPGSIDVNIMTKLNRPRFRHGEELPSQYSDALSALRGYAQSSLDSSIVFSAGFNQSLYGYISTFDDFFPDANGRLKKRIILKVSDYRSALIQGKFLAKRGLWVSEYRIESALNCGGHAFANDGFLTGPILEEFKKNRTELSDGLYDTYERALKSLGKVVPTEKLPVRVTAQGGIGTHEEHQFLLQHYRLDATGWATPFLLVPEVVNIDDEHLEKLCLATEADVKLNTFSPLGISFWNLLTSASEHVRLARIQAGAPGSPCPKGFLMCNNKLSDVPYCPASRDYLKVKLPEIEKLDVSDQQKDLMKQELMNKACICHDLAGSATLKYGIDKKATMAICCGPNIVNFSKVVSLEEMVNHIYGRMASLAGNKRPHMFIKELMIHIDYLQNEVRKSLNGLLVRPQAKLHEVKANLFKSIEYYQSLSEELFHEKKDNFLALLNQLSQELSAIPV